MQTAHDHRVRGCEWATRQRRWRRMENAIANNAKSNIVGTYVRAGHRKKEWETTTENLTKAEYDPDDDVEETKTSQE